jgi:hypothetical protein
MARQFLIAGFHQDPQYRFFHVGDGSFASLSAIQPRSAIGAACG